MPDADLDVTSTELPEPQVRRIERASTNVPSVNEIEKAMKTMKNNKAPGFSVYFRETREIFAKLENISRNSRKFREIREIF